MKKHLLRWLITGGIVLLFALGSGVWMLLLHNQNTTVFPFNQPPTPSLSRTTYTNTRYGYSFVYPSEWKLIEHMFQGIDTVHASYQVQAGDANPVDISCQSNAGNLEEQSWWKQNNKHISGSGIGFIKLKSGVTAYFAVEHGQIGIEDYTLTHNQIACSFSMSLSNQANNAITNEVVNSFRWK